MSKFNSLKNQIRNIKKILKLKYLIKLNYLWL